jgi:acyl carrier protein
VSGPAHSGVSPLLSEAVSQVSGTPTYACANRALQLQDDLGIDSLALAELVEVISARAEIVITDEETGRARTVGELQDILDAHAAGSGTTPVKRGEYE